MTLIRKRSLALLIGAGAAAGVALAGCSSSTPTSPDTSSSAAEACSSDADYGDINVQLSWIKNAEFAGETLALDKGYYTDCGFGDVTLTSGPSTGQAELDSGTAQFALSDAASVAAADAGGDDLVILATTYQKNPFTIVSLGGSGLDTPESLIGKKIGVDSSNTSLFNAFLAVNGIDPSQVTVVPGQFNGPSMVESGQADAYVAYITNEAIQIQADTGSVTRLDFADNGFPYVAETITASKSYVEANHDLVKAFLTAEIKGWSDTFTDSEDDVVSTVIEHFEAAAGTDALDPDETKAEFVAQKDLVANDDTEANGLFTVTDDLKDETIASMQAAGFDVSADQIFDTSILDEIYSDNPELKTAYLG